LYALKLYCGAAVFRSGVFDVSSRKPLVGNSSELSIRGAQGAQRPERSPPREARPPQIGAVWLVALRCPFTSSECCPNALSEMNWAR